MRIALLGLTLLALPVAAAEWSAEPTLRFGAEYNENLLLEPGDTEAAPGASLDLRASLVRRTEKSALGLVPRLRFLRYDTSVDYDSDDQFLDLTYEVHGERLSTNLSAAFARDSTLTSELESTGFVDARKRHERAQVNASVSADVSERNQVGVDVHAQDNQYRDAELTGLVDYKYARAYGWFSRGLSERTQLGAQLSNGELEVSETGERSRDRSVHLTLQHSFASHWLLDAFAGVDQSTTMQGSSDGTVYGLTLQRRGERNDWRISARQDVAPAGYGELVRRQDAAASWSRRLTQTFQFTANVRYLHNEELQVLGTDRDREYQRADMRIDWRVGPSWQVAAGLAYARQRFAPDDSIGDARIATISFNYAPPRAAISR